MAIEIGPAHQGQQMGRGPVQQAAIGVAAEHHGQIQALGGPGHHQGLREAPAFEQLDVDAIHMGGQAHQIGQIPATFIRHQGHRAIGSQRRKSRPIGLGIGQGRQGLLQQHHPMGRQRFEHGAGPSQAPAPIGIHLQFDRRAGGPFAGLQGLGHGPQQG